MGTHLGGEAACSMSREVNGSNLTPTGICGKMGRGMFSPPGANSMAVMSVIAAVATSCLVCPTMVALLIN